MLQGERIRKIRNSYDMSMESFGRKIGVTKATISNIENGHRNPSEQMILSICREFGVKESWLRDGEGEPFEKASDDLVDQLAKKYGLSAADCIAVRRFMMADAKTRKAILDYMSSVADDLMKLQDVDQESAVRDREWYHRELDRELDDEKRAEESGSDSSAS